MNTNINIHMTTGDTPTMGYVCNHAREPDAPIHMSVDVRMSGDSISLYGSPAQLRSFAYVIIQGIDQAMKERYAKEV